MSSMAIIFPQWVWHGPTKAKPRVKLDNKHSKFTQVLGQHIRLSEMHDNKPVLILSPWPHITLNCCFSSPLQSQIPWKMSLASNHEPYSFLHFLASLTIKKIFLAMLRNMWDLSSLTRDRTHALCRGSVDSWALNHQGIPLSYFLIEYLWSSTCQVLF